jgi:hypothetical protein
MIDDRARVQGGDRGAGPSESMSLLRTLSGGLGHDLGNLLMPLLVRLEALAGPDLPDRFRPDVQVLRAVTDRLHRLADGLRLMALDPGAERTGETTDLASWWEEAGPVLKNVLPRHLRLEGRMPGEPCRAAISRAGLTHTVIELLLRVGAAADGRSHEIVTVRPVREGDAIEMQVASPTGTTHSVRVAIAGAGSAMRRRRAVVVVDDKRLRALAKSELEPLGFDVAADAGPMESAPDLVVLDEGRVPHEGATAVVLGRTDAVDADGLITLPRRPSTRQFREALRRAAAMAASPRAHAAAGL